MTKQMMMKQLSAASVSTSSEVDWGKEKLFCFNFTPHLKCKLFIFYFLNQCFFLQAERVEHQSSLLFAIQSSDIWTWFVFGRESVRWVACCTASQSLLACWGHQQQCVGELQDWLAQTECVVLLFPALLRKPLNRVTLIPTDGADTPFLLLWVDCSDIIMKNMRRGFLATFH